MRYSLFALVANWKSFGTKNSVFDFFASCTLVHGTNWCEVYTLFTTSFEVPHAHSVRINSCVFVFGPVLAQKAVHLTFSQPVLAWMGLFGVQFIAISRILLLATSFVYPLLLGAAKNCFICISHLQQI